MNEQIDKLLVKAGAYFGAECVVYDNFDPKKFAELIVRECVDIVSDTAVNTPPNDLFYGYNLGVNKAAENIKERFGIEE